MMKKEIHCKEDNKRIDLYLKEELDLSRNRIQKLIKSGKIKVASSKNNKYQEIVIKPSYKVKLDDLIICELEEERESILKPQPIKLEIIYEDEDIIVINKPAGILTHPTFKIKENTLVNGLLYHTRLEYPNNLRPGVVHRLDKDTSGLIVFAKTKQAYFSLVEQFKERKVYKEYIGIVWGIIKKDSLTIDIPIGYSKKGGLLKRPYGRLSKFAKTYIEVIKRLPEFTVLKIIPYTGRTHQIRVHLKYINHPIVGDKVYSKKSSSIIKRQALHANKLGFYHPSTNKYLEFKVDLPEDMKNCLKITNLS